MDHFNLYSFNSISNLISKREGETKLGEKLNFVSKVDELRQIDSSYVILGIPESFGPRANFGKNGAENAWPTFLKSFVNVQYNEYTDLKNVVLLGSFELEYLQQNDENINQLRKTTQIIDDLVYPLIHTITESGHTPIVIGGGHNNCYPIIKGISMARKSPLQCINIDPHADFRVVEGRHSGNGFSYAFNDGLLEKYHVFGLHENYNSQYLFDQFKQIEGISYTLFETLLFNKDKEVLKKALSLFNHNKIGVEIDLDSIAFMPSSAFTPSGFSVEEVRQIMNSILNQKKAHYLHICEGAPLNEKDALIVGKTISYLVSDFIKK